jgi:excisionase family DNA binding protein
VYAAIRPDEHNHKHRRLRRAAGPPPFHPQGGLLSLNPLPIALCGTFHCLCEHSATTNVDQSLQVLEEIGETEMGIDPEAQNFQAPRANVFGHFEPLCDSDQAAGFLGVHPKTLQKMARDGRVPAHRIGTLWRFRISELDEWLRTSVHSVCHSCR